MRWLQPLQTTRSRILRFPRAFSGLFLGVTCALLVQAVASVGWINGLERGALDTLFRHRGQQFGASEIVLVIANDETIAKYETWPLPRQVYADLVRHLHQSGVKTIAFDLLFSENSQRSADDAELVRACRDAGNVVQGAAFHVEGLYNPSLPVSSAGLRGTLPGRFAVQPQSGRVTWPLPSAVWASTPLSPLRDHAPLLGHINVHPQRDGTLRTIPHIIRYRGELYPSLSLAAAAHFWDVPANDIQVTPEEIRVAGRRFPLEGNGETGVNWTGGNGTFATYSIAQILSGQVPREVLENKIVLIGATAAGSFEYRATPFSSVQPALEIQATALDNILLNRPLRFAPQWVAFALMLLFAAVTGALIAPRLDLGGTALLLLLTGVLWLAAWWLLKEHHFYLPLAPALLAAAFTYALTMAINYRQEWEENLRTEAAVATLAHGGALMASGYDGVQLQAVVRQTATDALRAQEVFLVHENSGDELLRQLSQQLSTQRRATIFPFPRRAASTEKAFEPQAQAIEHLQALARRVAGKDSGKQPSIVAAPLLRSKSTPSENAAHPAPTVVGALIAVGSQDGRPFNSRDAILLETLAEQAGLALENLEYHRLLQSRVDLANRDLREAYSVLSEQSAKFMAAVESIDDALIICDAAGHAIFINEAATATLLHATPQLGQCVPEVLRDNGLPELADLFSESVATPEELDGDPRRAEATFSENGNAQSDRSRVLSAQLTPLASDGKRPLGAMLLVADVTTQRELDQMKTDFVSFVAHELRSPLGAILGYASLLQDYSEKADPAMRNEMMSAITRQCHRLNRMIGDLLDISRLEAGRLLDLRRERVDLRSLTEKVLDAQRASLSNPDITLALQCEDGEVAVWGDVDRIEQILMNLVSNATKYSPDGGAVVVALKRREEGVSLQIRDSGMGMTPQQVEKLFQKFFRSSEARLRGIKGTGLGLFLVKNLVEAHNGCIEVESEIGQGTTFTVWLPQRSDSPETNAQDATEQESQVSSLT